METDLTQSNSHGFYTAFPTSSTLIASTAKVQLFLKLKQGSTSIKWKSTVQNSTLADDIKKTSTNFTKLQLRPTHSDREFAKIYDDFKTHIVYIHMQVHFSNTVGKIEREGRNIFFLYLASLKKGECIH